MKPVLIAPSVIAADFSYLRAEIARAEQGGADMLHVDIMDGHFVPNITFGPDIVKTIKSLTKLPLDVHLMISKPRKFITNFVEAGASNITFHIECDDVIRTAIDEIVYYSCKVGLSVKPRTPLSAVEEYLHMVDRLLIMTVEPGFGGQKFMPDMMAKVRQAVEWRRDKNFKYDIEVDGGLNNHTIWDAARAGAEVIVAGTSVFSQVDLGAAIQDLRDNAKAALAYLDEPPPEGEPPIDVEPI
jgi:ribulose-phosphate 3-epimerase